MMADKATPRQVREHQLQRELYIQGVKDSELVIKIVFVFVCAVLGAAVGVGALL
jgi:hypothetical protein